MTNVDDINKLYQSDYYKFIGISDPLACFFIDEIIEKVNPRILIVERAREEVDRMLSNGGLGDKILTNYVVEKIKELKLNPEVLWVPYDALNTKRVMQKIYWHLMPGMAFDEERFEEMNKMTIQIDQDKAMELATKVKTNGNSILNDIPVIIEREASHGSNLRQKSA